MTTLATMKARIASDLVRDDLATEIATSIEDAIDAFRTTRFWFNELNDNSFSTVAAQAFYGATDDEDVSEYFEIDSLLLTTGSGANRWLTKSDPLELDWITDTSGANGEPNRWAAYNGGIRLYPVPDAVYTVRMTGGYEFPSPASDAEADNVWMTTARALITARAKFELYTHNIKSTEKILIWGGQDGLGGKTGVELQRLRREGTKRMGTGRLVSSSF